MLRIVSYNDVKGSALLEQMMVVICFYFAKENVKKWEKSCWFIIHFLKTQFGPWLKLGATGWVEYKFDLAKFHKTKETLFIFSGGGGETECLTCSLIQMGSSMAYGECRFYNTRWFYRKWRKTHLTNCGAGFLLLSVSNFF